MLSEDLLISYRYESVYPFQLKQSLSTEPDKSLLNGSSWNLVRFLSIGFNLAILHYSEKVDNYINKFITFLKVRANTSVPSLRNFDGIGPFQWLYWYRG